MIQNRSNISQYRKNRLQKTKQQKQIRFFIWGLVIVLIVVASIFVALLVVAKLAGSADVVRQRDQDRVAGAHSQILAINNYRLDHKDNCPESLENLVPIYLDKLPATSGGNNYQYKIENEVCLVSIRLEDGDDYELKNDDDPSNGNILDIGSYSQENLKEESVSGNGSINK